MADPAYGAGVAKALGIKQLALVKIAFAASDVTRVAGCEMVFVRYRDTSGRAGCEEGRVCSRVRPRSSARFARQRVMGQLR